MFIEKHRHSFYLISFILISVFWMEFDFIPQGKLQEVHDNQQIAAITWKPLKVKKQSHQASGPQISSSERAPASVKSTIK